MRVGSLFTGIGGLDLGLERAGMHVVWQSEIDPYACRVLAKHWPDIPNLGDITRVDWTHVEPPDLVCGGYPCQPFSLAGVRQGETDRRHLWPHFADCLRHLRPRWALLENVPGHLSLGFGRVLGDLADLGYDADWDCIPAAAVGAPHLRYRVFVVAHTGEPRRRQDTGSPSGDEGADARRATPDDHVADGDGQSRGTRDVADAAVERLEGGADGDGLHAGEGRIGGGEPARSGSRIAADVADADQQGSQGHRPEHRLREDRPQEQAGGRGDVPDAEVAAGGTGLRQSATRSGPGRVDVTEPGDGGWWSAEPDVGRVAHGVPSRVDRLRCLGNAVVPQVAELIGRRIMEAAT